MTRQQMMNAIRELPDDLQQKLLAAPHGLNTTDFSIDEQELLEDQFGERWQDILGFD